MADKCSCGARDKSKCSKENGLGGGKMCLKPDNYPELPEISSEKSIEISERGRENILDRYYSDENRLLTDPEYSKQWVEEEVRKSGEWFVEEIYK